MDTLTPISPLNDPVAIVRHLDPDQIRGRLADLDRERRALLTLLRAAVASKKEVARAH